MKQILHMMGENKAWEFKIKTTEESKIFRFQIY